MRTNLSCCLGLTDNGQSENHQGMALLLRAVFGQTMQVGQAARLDKNVLPFAHEPDPGPQPGPCSAARVQLHAMQLHRIARELSEAQQFLCWEESK